MKRLRIWKLTPKDLTSADWQRSTYRGDVLIRADSANTARQVAANTFGIATRVQVGEKVQVNPWTNESLVSAVTVEDEAYEEEGESKVVGPREALRHA